MSHDVGWQLLAHIFQAGTLKEAQSRHVTEKMFGTKLQRRVWTFAVEHHKQYRKTPSTPLVAEKFPRAKVGLVVEEPTSYYLDQLIIQYGRTAGAEMLRDAALEIRDDPLGVFEQLRIETTAMLGRSTPSTDISMGSTHAQRFQQYRSRERGENIGIQTPYETWNEITLGLQEEDFILITARPNVGKTFFILWNAIHVAYKEMMRVVFFTKEMSIAAMGRRHDAMYFGLPWREFRKGMMTTQDKARYKAGLKDMVRKKKRDEVGELIMVSDAKMTTATIDAKIEQLRPDAVFIDGLYLVQDEARTADKYIRVANVSSETKAIAQSHSLPIVGTSQIHRVQGNLEKSWQALTLADLAFTDALAQDTDIVWCLIRTMLMRENRQMLVKNLKIREDEARDFGVAWDLGTMQNTFQELPLVDGQLPIGDMEDSVEEDEEEVDWDKYDDEDEEEEE